MTTLEVKTRILPGGRIEIPATNLPEGSEVTVRIMVAEDAPKRQLSEILKDYPGGQSFETVEEGEALNGESADPPKKSFLENLGDYKGGQSFKTVEEVDRYLQEERDSWGD